jgi:hypothetical protein
MSSPTPYPPREAALGEAQRLAREATAAAELRAWQTHPDVIALRVERIRVQVDRLMWTGIVLGLCFTMTNVQHFAAAGAGMGSLAWWAAWLMDPMVSLVLLAVLRAEQLTTRYHIPTGLWPRATKWALLAATYLMNTWTSGAAGSASGVALHSVPPLVVVLAAEAVTDVQHALTDCVHRAHTLAIQRAEHRPHSHPSASLQERPTTATGTPQALVRGGGGDHPGATPGERAWGEPGERLTGSRGKRTASAAGERQQWRAVNPAMRSEPHPPPRAGGDSHRAPDSDAEPRRAAGTAGRERRKLLADYVAEARAAWRPGVVVSPAWVRSVTDCSRGLSSKVAAALSTDAPTTPAQTLEPPATGPRPGERAA